MKPYKIVLHNTERKSAKYLNLYLEHHPVIADEVEIEISPDENVPDATIFRDGAPFQAYEFKFGDAKSSRNTYHIQNNLTKMLRQFGEEFPLFLLIVDEHKRISFRNKGKIRFNEIIDKSLIGNLFHLAYSMGFQAYYMSVDRFADVLITIIRKDKERLIDMGYVWLERTKPYHPTYLHRNPASKYEISLQPFEGLTIEKAYILSHDIYKSYRELVWAGTGYNQKTGEFQWMPDWIELDKIWPPTDDNEESSFRKKFLQEIGGNLNE